MSEAVFHERARLRPAKRRSEPAKGMKASDIAARLTAAGVALSLFPGAGQQPLQALILSAMLLLLAGGFMIVTGPTAGRISVLLGGAVLIAYAFSGLAGPLDRSAPGLAVLVSAGAVFAVGWIAAGRKGFYESMLGAFIWCACLFCAAVFFNAVSNLDRSASGAIGFDTPETASVVFGMLILVGLGRISIAFKRARDSSLSRSDAVDRSMRHSLGGLLLMGLALACLAATGSNVGQMYGFGMALLYFAWEMRRTSAVRARGWLLQLMFILTPIAGLALVGGGVVMSLLPDTSEAGAVDNLLARRWTDLGAAWSEQIWLGHGVGSFDTVRDSHATLFNYAATSGPDGAHNVVLNVLVESGLLGAGLLLIVLLAVHAQVVRGALGRRSRRSLARLAICLSGLLALHGMTQHSLDTPSVIWMYALVVGMAAGTSGTKRLGATTSQPVTGSPQDVHVSGGLASP
ncbi:MAG: O-antigen ligase family protein [Hyphomonadaceae bacterium]